MRIPPRHALVCIVTVALMTAATEAEAGLRYICFGDSITLGVGDDPLRIEFGYPPRLRTRLRQAGEPDPILLNRGVGGEKTPDGLTRIDSVLNQGGDVLLLMEGTNDISQSANLGISLETTLFNLEEMARKAEFRGIEAVHATVIPRLDDAKVDRFNITTRRLNQGIRDIAGRMRRNLADHFETFDQQPDLFENLYWAIQNDPVGHPNGLGYDLMADVFAEALVGEDKVAPTVGLISPYYIEQGVAPNTSIDVDVWDFGEGTVRKTSRLYVNGIAVENGKGGPAGSIHFRHTPENNLSGIVSVSVFVEDDADPPNYLAREVSLFSVAGVLPFLNGDANENGKVDGGDLTIVEKSFGARRGEKRWDARADFNGDDIVDGDDLAFVALDWDQTPF